MSDAKKEYSKLMSDGDKQWRKYKETGNPRSKKKAKDKYYQADFLKEQAKQPVNHVNNVEINVNSKNSTSKKQSILSNNKLKFKLFPFRRKNKKTTK